MIYVTNIQMKEKRITVLNAKKVFAQSARFMGNM